MALENWFYAVGLVIGTAFLLIAALAWYDLLLQCFTFIGLFGSSAPLEATYPGTIFPPTTVNERQLWGQFIYTAIMTIVAVVVLWYFEPFGSANDVYSEKSPGSNRGRLLSSQRASRGAPIPGVVVLK